MAKKLNSQGKLVSFFRIVREQFAINFILATSGWKRISQLPLGELRMLQYLYERKKRLWSPLLVMSVLFFICSVLSSDLYVSLLEYSKASVVWTTLAADEAYGSYTLSIVFLCLSLFLFLWHAKVWDRYRKIKRYFKSEELSHFAGKA